MCLAGMGRNGLETGRKELAEKSADQPEKKSQYHAKQQGSNDWKGDRPVLPSPREVAWQPSQGQVETSQQKNGATDYEKQEAEEDQGTAQIKHG